jgi:N-dimethylarginine dimethylaminohydrolase
VRNKELFLCPPVHLELKYEINPWMDTSQAFSRGKAMEQWEALVEAYRKLAPDQVHTVPPKPGLTELCFLGDSVFACGKKALYGNFRHPERAPERDYVVELMTSWGFTGNVVPEPLYYEGSGETLLWRDTILLGFGQRSNEEVMHLLQTTFGRRVISFEMELPEFYHLDTALFPLDEDTLVYYPRSFGPIDTATLKGLDCELFPVTDEEANAFACNSVVFEGHVFVNQQATSFIRKLERRGWTVVPVDVSEFLKFGGGHKCLTLQHYLPD